MEYGKARKQVKNIAESVACDKGVLKSKRISDGMVLQMKLTVLQMKLMVLSIQAFSIKDNKWRYSCPVAFTHPITVIWLLFPEVRYLTFLSPLVVKHMVDDDQGAYQHCISVLVCPLSHFLPSPPSKA